MTFEDEPKAKFKCAVCECAFDTQNNLDKHTSTDHGFVDSKLNEVADKVANMIVYGLWEDRE